MQLVGCEFGAAQDKANLRTVTVRDHNIPTVNDHVGDVFHRLRRGLILIGNGLMVLVFD